ncbi:Swc5p NDAI_0F01950 [Naumovozyma dairenensis CBS 421]|uniref:SWR1-complex protein 5 n=1 Tax=Naumovozyma dairenensis (strain ATCC 10597 / BCRC 20456 / CBS 421 / NBRC 0211 / NRRL Y-12639) TaxID=1071378 RepID=G0WCK2_NAUDC|nr:hypothetical protein NDAI_0F01950 [Naumovozyma dairenensis CBS 421]CCD25513.1 hypothetical protein NDAI_0F01950 [Naumovozyma dairenensis CBS 421]
MIDESQRVNASPEEVGDGADERTSTEMMKEGESVDVHNSNDLEDEYNEEEDEDFDPDKVKVTLGDADDDDDDDDDAETNLSDDDEEEQKEGKTRSGKNDYSKIESETGGLIKTRKARQLEEELNRKRKYEQLEVTSVPSSINDIWEELKQTSNKRLSKRHAVQGKNNGSVLATSTQGDEQDVSSFDDGSENILIERSYKFAGELIHEKKYVSRSSAEGREYLNAVQFQDEMKTTEGKEPNLNVGSKEADSKDGHGRMENLNLRRPLKRQPILEQIISGAIKPKLTTLEKSKLDWATYVDKEGINDELQLYNKDGYLAKQDFLNRVESKKDEKYKEFRQKQIQLQLQESQQNS